MLNRDLLVIDVETTGLDPHCDAIVQLSACVLSHADLREQACFTTLVFPEAAMSPRAQAVHGLTPEQLQDAPRVHEAIAAFDRFAPKDALICGHNVSFDVGFLKAAYKRAEFPFGFDYHTVDIWSISFFVLGARGIELRSYNLDALCGLFGVARDRHHNALQDVRASAAILRHLYQSVGAGAVEVLGQYELGIRS